MKGIKPINDYGNRVDNMERRIDIFSTEGISIEYSMIGKGEPVFVMHGGHSNCHEEFGYESLVQMVIQLLPLQEPDMEGLQGRLARALQQHASIIRD